MELRQPRGFGNEGRKTTHDFLSLYSPPAQQDPRPPPEAGGFLKTHNFLQPLEQDDVAKDEDIIEIKDDEEKPPLNVEHILPGGIGTYSITYFNERFPKPEGSVYMMAQATSSTNMNDDNSNCSSYTGSGFTLWDEPATKKGQTGKENYFAGDRPVLREAGVNGRAGDWPTSLERPTQSSSNHIPSTRSFSSPSSSQPSTAQNHSFLNMLTSAKSAQEEDDDDDDEEDVIIKKEPSPHPKGPFALKADGRSTIQKPSTPRSKHSATEQRRRSKINDRLQKLREIIPHGDQKRDRASFLLEVIEYIQFLQEKVHKYEGTYPGWNQDGPKLTPWKNPGATEDLVNSAHLMKMAMNPALLLPSKLDGKKFGTSPLHPINGQHLVHEAELSSPSIFREKVPQPEPGNMATASIPSSKRPSVFPFGGSNSETIPLSSRPVPEPERTVPQSQFWLRDPLTADCNATDKLKDQELAIESGRINISSIYSQGLFSTLTQALQSSGIDLSQANISVQIDLGKKGNGRVDSSASAVKDTGMPLDDNQEMPRSSITRTGEDCSAQQAVKRFKSCRS